MLDSRFETPADDTAALLATADVDDLDDLETMLMFLLDRPARLSEVVGEDGADVIGLEVVVVGDDYASGTIHDFPLTIIELARSGAETADELGPYTGAGRSLDSPPDVAGMDVGDLVTALQRALGNVRLFAMLEDDDPAIMLPPDDESDESDEPGEPGEPYAAARGTCPSCGSGEVEHLVIGMPSGPHAMSRDPDWVHWVGCVHPGYSRRCGSCDATWNPRA